MRNNFSVRLLKMSDAQQKIDKIEAIKQKLDQIQSEITEMKKILREKP